MSEDTLRQELSDSFDRWKPYFTPDQIAAVALVLYASDQVPGDEAMERYRRIAAELFPSPLAEPWNEGGRT